MPKVDFVIATTHLRMAERCIASIRESCEEYLGSIITVIRPEVAYATAVEQGWRGAREDYVCFVNDDAFPTGQAMQRLMTEIERDDKIGAVGPGIPCRTHQGSQPRAEKRLVVDVPFLTTACAVVRRSTLEAVGGWDTRYALYACDIDLMFRIADAGYRLVWVRDAWVNHILGASSERVPEKEELSHRDHELLESKFPGRLGKYPIIPIEPVCERPLPGADGFAEKRYEMAKLAMNGAKRVLDLGCGWGTGARVFSEQEYVGIDVDPDCIAYAQTRMPGDFLVLRADDETSDFEAVGNNFQAVCAFEVIEHVDNPQQMLQNAVECMTDEARIFISTPERRGVFNPHHKQEWLKPELEGLLNAYFDDVHVELHDFGFLAPTLWAECGRPKRN